MADTFGATSTIEDVLANVDLRGRRILVTGVSAGIGVETVRALVAHGAKVVGTARNLRKAQAATQHVRAAAAYGGGLELVELDLASLASVRSCANSLVSARVPFDEIIANAGLMAGPKVDTADGFEAQFGTNYLGHFVLVNRIAGLLNPGGRVVMVSSAGHRRAWTTPTSSRVLTASTLHTDAPKRRPSSLQSSSTNVIEPRAFELRPFIRVPSRLKQFRR